LWGERLVRFQAFAVGARQWFGQGTAQKRAGLGLMRPAHRALLHVAQGISCAGSVKSHVSLFIKGTSAGLERVRNERLFR
jgi:hypothetical protein